jgi:beta propeller repeat protein
MSLYRILIVLAIALVVCTSFAEAAEVRITSDPADQTSPAIWEERIVWTDARSKNLDIYLYDTLAGTETRITKGPKDRKTPAIWEDLIVAVDMSQGSPDIYLYNLVTGSGRMVTTMATNQKFPRVSENLVVWETSRNGDNDIVVYDALTGKEVKLPPELHVPAFPGHLEGPDGLGGYRGRDEHHPLP